MAATTHVYRYEARHFGAAVVEWTEVTEEFVCDRLAVETPDPRELNDLLIAMREGSTIGDGNGLVFRAVPVGGE